MKKWKLRDLMGLLAVLGLALRRLVYAGAVDGKNLIITGHPAVIALWLLTAAALVLAAFGCRKETENALADGPKPAAFLGHGMLGVGMLLSVHMGFAPAAGVLGLLWKILGMVSPVCLLYAGFQRMRGKAPFFGVYAAPCLFFAVHVIASYQIWCSNPQFTDYAFALLGSVCLCLHNYQLCAFPVGMGSRKMLTLTGLAAVYLCAAEMATSPYPALYFGGILFALINLEK